MHSRTKLFRAVLIVTVLAGALRLLAARNLWVDDDESIYMKRAVDYANFLRSGQYGMLASYDLTYEHPALYKILYGVVLLTRRPIEIFHTIQISNQPVATSNAGVWIIADRYLSVVFGTLTVAVLAIINPLAGLFLAANTLSVKYTSEVYLEALPMFTSLLCAITYLRWFGQIANDSAAQRRTNLWLAASAPFLGLTAASKYIYCVVGIVIALHFALALIQRQIPWRFLPHMIAWAVMAVGMFFVFDPYLWPDPIARLSQSIQYNLNYRQSEHVLKGQYPFWQPLRWLFSFSSFHDLGPASAFIINIDTPIFLLGVIGLPRLFQQKRFYFYWLVIALIFLLAWNTKWPQYALIALVPLSVSASEGVTTAWNLGREFFLSTESRSS